MNLSFISKYAEQTLALSSTFVSGAFPLAAAWCWKMMIFESLSNCTHLSGHLQQMNYCTASSFAGVRSIHRQVALHKVDMCDGAAVDAVFAEGKFDGVSHQPSCTALSLEQKGIFAPLLRC
eukprot:2217439-Amphidinium_carterae.1